MTNPAADQFANLFGPPDLSVVEDSCWEQPLFRCAGCRGRHPIRLQFRTPDRRWCQARAPADAIRSEALAVYQPTASGPLAQLARIHA